MATPATYFKGKCKSDEFVSVSGTATSAFGASVAATINKQKGRYSTSDAATTAAGATMTLTLTNSLIAATSSLFVTVGTAGTGEPCVHSVVCGAGSATIKIKNTSLTAAAFNAVLTIDFFVVN